MGKQSVGWVQRRGVLVLALVMSIPALLLCVATAIEVREYPMRLLISGPLSALLLAAGLLTYGRGRRSIVVATLLLTITTAALAAEIATYYVQGIGFSEEFFSYILLPGAYRGLAAYPILVAMVLAILLLAAALYWKLLAYGRAIGVGVAQPTAVLVGLVLIALGLTMSPWPRLIGAWSAFSALTSSNGGGLNAFKVPAVSKEGLVAAPGKNLILIYLESFDSIYLDEEAFPGLAPNIAKEAKEALHFSGMTNYPGIGYTMSGIFASQCGVPLSLGSPGRLDVSTNNVNQSQYRPALVCMGDVLKAAGYRQIFMGGADANFAGKSNFFRLHGYDEVLGLSDWQKSGSAPGSVSSWGLFDDKLFGIATARFDELASEGDPFNLTLLTLDTHGPDGAQSPSCKRYRHKDNSLLNAVHCTDQLVSRFLDKVKASPAYKDTVVVLMGDHASMRNIAHDLYPPGYVRTPIFIVINAGQGRHEADIYHMDVAPTLLSLLGVESNGQFIAGWSQQDPRRRVGVALSRSMDERRQLAEILYRDQPDIDLCKNNALVSWGPTGKAEIGGLGLSLLHSGYALSAPPSGAGAQIRISRKSASYFVVANPRERPSLVEGEVLIDIKPVSASRGKFNGYSLTAYNALGGQLRLVDHVESLKSVSLMSKECKTLEHAMRTATQSADARSLIAVKSSIPSIPSNGSAVRITKSAPVEWFVSGWAAPTDGGIWAVGNESKVVLPADASVCRGGKVVFHISPYVSPARPRLKVKVYPAEKRHMFKSVDFDFVNSTGDTLELDAYGVESGSHTCLLRYVFETTRKFNAAAKETAADVWPITFSLESVTVKVKEG